MAIKKPVIERLEGEVGLTTAAAALAIVHTPQCSRFLGHSMSKPDSTDTTYNLSDPLHAPQIASLTESFTKYPLGTVSVVGDLNGTCNCPVLPPSVTQPASKMVGCDVCMPVAGAHGIVGCSAHLPFTSPHALTLLQVMTRRSV